MASAGPTRVQPKQRRAGLDEIHGTDVIRVSRKPSSGLAFSYGLHPAPAAAVGLADRGLRYSEQAYRIANEQSDLLTLGHIYTMRSMACFGSGRYSQGIDFGLRGGEYLKSAGDPFLRYIAEIHAVLCYWQRGKPHAAIELGIKCFERSLKLEENAGMAGSLYVLTLTVEGRLPPRRTLFVLRGQR